MLILKKNMQVVQGMGEIYTNMGNILVILYSVGVRVLQGTTREPLHFRHCWPGGIPTRHYLAILCGLQGQSFLQNDLQA